jgi:hypothetical protein
MGNDLRVSVELALTLPIPGVDYGMVKPSIRIDNIDPSGDVDAQVSLGLETGGSVLARLDEHMEIAIHDMLAPETGAPGYRERLASVEKMQSNMVSTLNEVVRRVKAQSTVSDIADSVEAGKK